jgi:pimeloyl-ACP methyl ester carboxylesterase
VNHILPPQPWSFQRLPLAQPAGHWLHVLEAGRSQGPTLLFLHGAAGSWHNFRLQIECLQHHYRILSLDLRGHGLSPWPGGSSIEDFAQDVFQVIEAKINGPFALVGHSFGGCLATMVAQRMPDRVRGVALLNTAGTIYQGPLYRFLKIFARFSHWVAQIEPYWISCHGSVAHHLLWETLPQWNTWNVFEQLKMPCMVLAGRRDMLVPWRSSVRMAELLPQATCFVIPDGHHVCMWEHTALLRTHLESWLGRVQWD